MKAKKIIKSSYFFEEEMEQGLAEVPVEKPEAWDPDQELKVVGTSKDRKDGYNKVSGTARYTFDISLPGMVYARILRSEISHAKIKSLDISEAAKLPGVMDIITFENTKQIEWFGNSFLFDQHIRYQGDEIACVAAETEDIAEEACKLIKVNYEKLPFVLDAEKGLKNDSYNLHKEGNIRRGKPDLHERGDIEKGFRDAEEIVQETFTTQVEVHNPTEPHCSAVNWDGNKLTIWDSTQAVFGVRDNIAGSLGLPSSNVRVIKKYMGGGFGSKLAAGKYTLMIALIARKIGRPVKISLDRREMNLAVGNRPGSVQKLMLGAKKDGTLTAMHHYAYGPIGAYPSSARCSWPFITIYKCDNVKSEDYSVYTNTGPGRPFRAPGHVQGVFAMDSIMDMMAEKLEMDPLEFRLKNYAEKDQIWNIPYTSKRLRECYQSGAAAIKWDKRNKQPGKGDQIIKKGIGMASQIWWGGGGPPAYATIKMNRDASIQVLCGTQDIGTGTHTILGQVAAEVLELPLEKVSVILGDTAVCPYGPTSGGSVTAPSTSPAVKDAAEQMKDKLIQSAAAIWEIDADGVKYESAELFQKENTDKKMSVGELMREIRERVLITTGTREQNPEGYMINSFGAQFAEVEVDTLTGRIHVNKIVAAHDVGRVLNKKLMENQFQGGIIQGLGFALIEERTVDRHTGKVVTTNLHDYKMPVVKDTPDIEVIIVSKADNKISSTGAKGIGEPAMIPTAGAIANAVYNAIGVRLKSLPITPDKVLNALYSS